MSKIVQGEQGRGSSISGRLFGEYSTFSLSEIRFKGESLIVGLAVQPRKSRLSLKSASLFLVGHLTGETSLAYFGVREVISVRL